MERLGVYARQRHSQGIIQLPDFRFIHPRDVDLAGISYMMYDDFMCIVNRGAWLAIGNMNVWAS